MLKNTRELIGQLLAGLTTLHTTVTAEDPKTNKEKIVPILHYDLKPPNCLIIKDKPTETVKVKPKSFVEKVKALGANEKTPAAAKYSLQIADFDVSNFGDDGSTVGSPVYFSPEMFARFVESLFNEKAPPILLKNESTGLIKVIKGPKGSCGTNCDIWGAGVIAAILLNGGQNPNFIKPLCEARGLFAVARSKEFRDNLNLLHNLPRPKDPYDLLYGECYVPIRTNDGHLTRPYCIIINILRIKLFLKHRPKIRKTFVIVCSGHNPCR